MDFAARNAVNLSVLKRHDEYIVEIIDTSSHVVVYLFDRDQSTWTKKGVEGTISIQPVFGFIVMNRLGLDNFMAPLVDNMDLEFKDEYIIYRTDDDLLELFNIKTPPPPKRNIIDDLPRRYHTPPAITNNNFSSVPVKSMLSSSSIQLRNAPRAPGLSSAPSTTAQSPQ
ncbi:4729_t:CDS:2 [Entrophospora sp. SA101]|nr:4729_t:CDS:2 [Entrophospora sp. SA101]